MDLEELEERQVEAFRRRYERLALEARKRLERGETDTDTPDA
jgi:hypothetical protein